MSRLNELLKALAEKDRQLAEDLKREVEVLQRRRSFGLNFERHVPETVELPGRPVRRGDKVRFLPERGEPAGSVDRRLWRVTVPVIRVAVKGAGYCSSRSTCNPIHRFLKASGKPLTAFPRRPYRARRPARCPDFVFFHGNDDDVKVSIVDPHGHHLADALPKRKGLAEFAAEQGEAFHRIEALARMDDGTLRVLDLTDESVRNAVDAATDAKKLYLSKAATDYVI